jgi:membrane protease YdiL (CAAX protease family)
MFVTTVLLAPVVEETMFRGALFGSIRLRSRAVAYIVSALAFAAYHLWPFLFTDMWRVNALYALQYIPASVILAWCYERGNSIWAPITLHALINLLANAAVRLGGAAA